MKLYRYIAIIALSAAIVPLAAQSKKFRGKPLEAGLILGGSNYMGDLAKFINPLETRLMAGALCRFNYSDFITLRGTFSLGTIRGADKNYENDSARYARNLSFKSNIIEFAATVEWNILGYGETTRERPGSPFLFLGIAVFKFNPVAKYHYVDQVRDQSGNLVANNPELKQYDNQWVELQPLGTEGQETTKFNDRDRYPLTQISIPMGFGYKKQIDENWAIGAEFGLRKTFTDYLDDVSKDYVDDQIVGAAYGPLAAAMKDRSVELGHPQHAQGQMRGNPNAQDWYMFFGFTITRKILGGKQICFQF
jgi:hypothetical protein